MRNHEIYLRSDGVVIVKGVPSNRQRIAESSLRWLVESEAFEKIVFVPTKRDQKRISFRAQQEERKQHQSSIDTVSNDMRNMAII